MKARKFDRQIANGNVLAANKEKAEEMFHSIGKKYPEENPFISYDESIAYPLDSVKYLLESIKERKVKMKYK